MITIPQALEERLARVARQRGCSIDDLAGEAILRYREDSEDAHRAERILRRVRARRGKIYTLDQVAERLRLED